ncbi:MAG: DoxX family protein [Proteobacteria bacterium]|nr:DoxX family protein [Pseudomonadota bacterium]
MSSETVQHADGFLGRLAPKGQYFLEKLGWMALLIAAPLARVALAIPFLRSGLTKWSGFFQLSPAAEFLFEEQFKLHLFGHAYDFPFPDVLALLDSVAEIVLPCLLLIGLATRLSALGLLIMTAVIQLTVPEGWANFHLPWAALAVSIIALGPGRASVDFWIARMLGRRPAASSTAPKV